MTLQSYDPIQRLHFVVYIQLDDDERNNQSQIGLAHLIASSIPKPFEFAGKAHVEGGLYEVVVKVPLGIGITVENFRGRFFLK